MRRRCCVRGVLLAALILSCARGASGKPRDLSEYPLSVQIFESGRSGYQTVGRGNLIEGQSIRAFDFVYSCFMKLTETVGTQGYSAKWKKPGKLIQIVGTAVGDQRRQEACDLQVTLHEGYVYDRVNGGGVQTFTEERYKQRNGMAPPPSNATDPDVSHYPLRLAVLGVDWDPPVGGTRAGAGKGNLRLGPWIGSVDFTTTCDAAFGVTPAHRYLVGRWRQEGSQMEVLLMTKDREYMCVLKTNVHTDVYVLDASGTIRALSQEEFRKVAAADGTP